jgi:simple sugar transport system permease protein
VTDTTPELGPAGEEPTPPGQIPAPQARLGRAFSGWVGGILVPITTTVIAFLVGGLVVLATGKNPLDVYHAVFNGTGLNWLFPWVAGEERATAALNLQQTLLLTTPLMLTGLAVAFAFRCGMFNIGGQGQYFAGAYFSIWLGTHFAGMSKPLHIVFVMIVATLAGAAWAGIAGLLKATVGAHEVISTIMLNWIAIWIGSYLFGQGGPLQNPQQQFVPISSDIADSAKLPVFWGDPLLQGLHIGFFIAIGALVIFWIVLNRTTLGFEVRAVGFNPEAARYGGINVPRNYFLAMAISGGFAGLAGALDILGWQYRLGQADLKASTIGFVGIAVALLGRNTAVGVGLAALLFGALLNGTSGRQLDPSIFRPDLAGNLTQIIQGLVVLFVGAETLVLSATRFGRGRRRKADS